MKKVVVSVNFSGRYNKENISHEFINLFPSDDSPWYFYVPPYGCINKEFDETDYLLLVEHIDGKYTLLAIATYLKSTGVSSTNSTKKIANENKKDGDINYFGKTLNDWFKFQKNTLYVSYKQKKDDNGEVIGRVYFPNREITIEFEPKGSTGRNANTIYLPKVYYDKKRSGEERKRITGQSLVGYFGSDDMEAQIKTLISHGSIEEYDTGKHSRTPIAMNRNILDYIGRSSDEQSFSNWLNSYLQDGCFFDHFMKCICKIESKGSKKKIAKVEQATKNRNRIDLWLETDDALILIENKIQSQIHTSKDKDGKSISQLEDYYNYGNDYLLENKDVKCLKCFLLCPDYYESYYYDPSTGLWDRKICKELKYSELKMCIEDFVDSSFYKEHKTSYPYMDEFVRALQRHCDSKPSSVRDVILDRVARGI